MSVNGIEALDAPLPTDPEVQKTCTFAGVRETLKSQDLVSARHLTGWPVMGGAIVTMDGAAHRARRKLESEIFAHRNLARYEIEVLQPAINTALDEAASAHRDDDGVVRVDLIALGRRVMLAISAAIVGLDIGPSNDERLQRLDSCLEALIGGVTIEWSNEDHGDVLANAVHWKKIYGDEFVRPALHHRRDVHAATGSYFVGPPDLLATLLADESQEWTFDDILTEAVQYLVASSGTSVTAVVHTINHLIQWFENHPQDRDLVADSDFLRRAAMESLRLHPGPHILMRRAAADVDLSEMQAKQGDFVGANVREANRDPAAYGSGADEFDPNRDVRKDAPRDGFTFGGGRHVCIGRPLALGTYGRRDTRDIDGTIVRFLRSLFAAGVCPDPNRLPRENNGIDDRFDYFPVELVAL